MAGTDGPQGVAFGQQPLPGRVAVVAGGGRGIGAAIARTLADAGARVAVMDIDADRAREVSDAIAADGHVALPITIDLRSDEAVRSAFEQVRATLGPVTVLVNNAGGMTQHAAWGELVEWTDDAWDLIVSLNLRYVFLTCRAAIPQMREAGGGTIVNLASISGTVSAPRHAAYGAAKAGIVNLTASLAAELGPDRIRVNAVAPGGILTPASMAIMPPQELERFKASVPLGGPGRPKDVANVVLFFAGPASAHVTGQTLVVDGGATVTYPLKLEVTSVPPRAD